MVEQGADVEDISPELLERFTHWECSRRVVAVGVKTCMAAMRRFLTAAGYLTTHGPDVAMMSEVQAEVAAWRAWMGDVLGLVKKTIDTRCRYAAGLLDTVTQQGAIQWSRLTPGVVNAYVLDRGKGYSVVTGTGIVTAVRCLLGWALSTGRIDRDLRAGILKMPGTKRTLPRGVSEEHIAALLSVCDLATAIGLRDRALVLMLVRLGLRAGEAARLTLDDIDWRAGELKVKGKGREHTLPIPIDVGQGLEAWLQVRPPAVDRAVFVRMKAPRQMMTTQGLSGIIARLSDTAGIDRIYAHRLRHTAAMGVLAQGGNLIEARELLGHSHLVTTMTYAKVDLRSLRVLTVPFGQVPK